MSDCIFCKIVAGTIPSTTVYEDEHTLAFLDINPSALGHTLVIPKQHVENVFDAPADVLAPVYATAQKIARALQQTKVAGVNLISNNGAVAGQIVFHAHIHIIPRATDDAFPQLPTVQYDDDAHMQETAKRIRAVL